MDKMSTADEKIKEISTWWNMFRWPLRPGMEELDVIGKLVKRVDAGQGMVLGSTPELVDLLLRQQGLRVVILDNFEPSVRAMEKLGQENWTSVKIILSDWLTKVNPLNESLDLILAHNSFIFLQFPEMWEKLFKILRGYLDINGRIVARCFFAPSRPFNFETFFEQTFNRLRTINNDRPSTSDIETFKRELTAIRLGTALESINPKGVLECKGRNNRIDTVKKTLGQSFTHSSYREIMDAVFCKEFAKEGGLVPVAIPDWENVKTILETTGFVVESDIPLESEIFPGVIRCFSAVKN